MESSIMVNLEMRTMTTKVVKNGTSRYDVYIGRAKGPRGYFGNEHPIGYCKICRRVHDREDCLVEFEKDFLVRIEGDAEYRRRILSLKGKTLGCFCHPLPCHGHIIANWIDSHIEP